MDEPYILYVLAFSSVFLAARSLIDFGKDARDHSLVNKRLKVQSENESIAEAVMELRRKRGLDEDGNRVIKSDWLGRLVARSGLDYKPGTWAAIAIGTGAAVAGAAYYFLGLLAALAAFPTVALVGPYLVLSILGGKRERALGEQLPDALEIVVRSLQAGHPVPTAIALVGKETPDPLGSEFGLVADEISFGSSLDQAIEKMAARTEHPDINLFSAIVRLQTRTGGNLADLLASNSRTIRQRQKMRLKIKAASAEGRMSSLILTAAPFVVLLAMHMLTPSFYGDVLHEPLIQYGLGGALVWMAIGNFVMRKMTNFKI
ncbi:MAG: type II secretion system F family protein [Pseudomonadota bacterium]